MSTHVTMSIPWQQPLSSISVVDPRHKELWNQVMEALIIQQFERECDLLIQAPQIRFKRVQERSPRLFQEVPLKYIASYLRMTPETLSRIQNS